MKRTCSFILAVILILALLTGCGASSKDASANEKYTYSTNSTTQKSEAMDMGFDSKSEASYEEVVESEAVTGENGAGKGSESGQSVEITLDVEKLVYRANVRIETLAYEEAYNKLKADIAAIGGIIQYESESDNDHGWYYEGHYKTRGTLEAYISCRIPTGSYADFMKGMGGYGKVIDKNSTVENISQRYNDATTRIESLKIQEQRLLDMLDKAVTIEEMLNIEDRLEEVRYEINSLETDVRHMDMDVAYSYVNITLSEVFEYTPDETPTKSNTFLDRLANTLSDSADGFLDFCEGLLFNVIILAPYAVILFLILLVISKLKRKPIRELFRFKRKSGKKAENISEEKPEA